MKKFINYLSGFFLASLLALGLATIGSYKANDQLVVRDVLSQDVTKDVTGKKVRKENAAVETKGLVSEVKAQVSEPVEDKISIRFVAGIDSYLYNTAKFDIKVEDANKNFEGKVTTAYTAIEVGSGVLTAQEVFGTEYNYLIAFTINGVPSEFWGSTFEVTASIQENEESEVFTSNVSYKVINDMIDADSSTVLVFDAEDLKEIANNVNNNIDSYAGKTVKLMKDIDLNNELWTPIGTKGDLQGFKGDFDGNNKTISNLKIDQTATPASLSAGLFGSANGGVIKNFTIDGADIKSVTTGSATTNGTAVVVGSSQFGLTIENVDVKNANVEGNRYVGIISGYFKGTITGSDVEDATITARPDLFTGSYDNGDKAGTIIGYSNGAIKLANNTVTDVEITGYRDLGGIAGMASRTILENNTVTNLVINVDQITGNMGERTPTADAFVGRYSANEELGAGNTSSNVTINVWTPSKTV